MINHNDSHLNAKKKIKLSRKNKEQFDWISYYFLVTK